MDPINERIAAVVSRSGLTKTAFAERLKVTQQHISNLCLGKKSPSRRTISDICREFHISEDWLRTGTGKMIEAFSEDEEMERLISSISKDELIKRIIRAYLRLDDTEKTAVKKLIDGFTEDSTIVLCESPLEEDLETEADEFAAIAREQYLREKRQENPAYFVDESDAG